MQNSSKYLQTGGFDTAARKSPADIIKSVTPRIAHAFGAARVTINKFEKQSNGRAAEREWRVKKAALKNGDAPAELSRLTGGYVITVYKEGPHEWRTDEIELLRELSDRVSLRLIRAHAEEALVESEERFHLAAQAVRSVIYDWDIATDCVNRSQELIEMLGFDPDNPKVCSNAWYQTRLHPNEKVAALDAVLQAVNSNTGRFEIEHRLRHRDGNYIDVSDVGLFIRDAKGRAVRCVGSITNITAEKAQTEEIRRHRDELEELVIERTAEVKKANRLLLKESAARESFQQDRLALLKQIITVQEDERRRIARDMHDHFGQKLTAMRLNLEAIQHIEGLDDGLRNRFAQTQQIAETLDSEVNFLVWELRPTALDDLGLKQAIENYVNRWAEQFKTEANFYGQDFDDSELHMDVVINLYRIAQEALNNTAKHASATKASVVIEKRNNKLIMIVEDDGRGFTASTQKRSGLGLRGMHERAELVGGSLEIESGDQKGTTIYVKVPLFSKAKTK